MFAMCKGASKRRTVLVGYMPISGPICPSKSNSNRKGRKRERKESKGKRERSLRKRRKKRKKKMDKKKEEEKEEEEGEEKVQERCIPSLLHVGLLYPNPNRHPKPLSLTCHSVCSIEFQCFSLHLQVSVKLHSNFGPEVVHDGMAKQLSDAMMTA